MHVFLYHDTTFNHTQCLIIILMYIFSTIIPYYCTLTKSTAYSEANPQDPVLPTFFQWKVAKASLKSRWMTS